MYLAVPCSGDLVMANLSPLTHPMETPAALAVSPKLPSTVEPSYSLQFPATSPAFPSFPSYKATDGDDDSFDTDSFTLDAPTAHHFLPLSPTSSSSLSPPHSLSSLSSMSSVSPPPCTACSTCCAQARRLSLLVPALKRKVVHTAELVSLYQSTRAQLAEAERRLQDSERTGEEVRLCHDGCDGRLRTLREEAELRDVRLRAQESHIAQLKASYSKLLLEREERGSRERSVKELQRENDLLVQRCERLREQAERLKAEQRKEEEDRRKARTAEERIEWLIESPSHGPNPIIIDVPHLSPSHLFPPAPSTPSQPTATPSNATTGGTDEGSTEFDVSQTMALGDRGDERAEGAAEKEDDRHPTAACGAQGRLPAAEGRSSEGGASASHRVCQAEERQQRAGGARDVVRRVGCLRRRSRAGDDGRDRADREEERGGEGGERRRPRRKGEEKEQRCHQGGAV